MMEGLQKAYDSARGSAAKFGAYASSLDKTKAVNASTSGFGSSSPAYSGEQSQVLATRSSRQFLSVWNCSKLCAFFFVAGIFVGYTLKRRVKRWASRILKRLKDE